MNSHDHSKDVDMTSYIFSALTELKRQISIELLDFAVQNDTGNFQNHLMVLEKSKILGKRMKWQCGILLSTLTARFLINQRVEFDLTFIRIAAVKPSK